MCAGLGPLTILLGVSAESAGRFVRLMRAADSVVYIIALGDWCRFNSSVPIFFYIFACALPSGKLPVFESCVARWVTGVVWSCSMISGLFTVSAVEWTCPRYHIKHVLSNCSSTKQGWLCLAFGQKKGLKSQKTAFGVVFGGNWLFVLFCLAFFARYTGSRLYFLKVRGYRKDSSRKSRTATASHCLAYTSKNAERTWFDRKLERSLRESYRRLHQWSISTSRNSNNWWCYRWTKNNHRILSYLFDIRV